MRSSISLAAASALLLFISTTSYSQSVWGDPGVTAPQVTKQPKAEAPAAAKKSGLGGAVTVRVTVATDGTVTAVESITGPGWVCPSVTRADVVALREAAREAAMKTRFNPALRGSVPETATTSVTFEFPEDPRTKIFAGAVAVAPPGAKEGERNPNVYTVKGDQNYSAASVSPGTPPDFKAGLSGGVLNGKAISLPRPPYPAAARAVRASGLVNIQVLIDEEGNIFSAEPVGGHPLLRSAARSAACSAKFTPTMLAGKPVKVSGVIAYNFVAP